MGEPPRIILPSVFCFVIRLVGCYLFPAFEYIYANVYKTFLLPWRRLEQGGREIRTIWRVCVKCASMCKCVCVCVCVCLGVCVFIWMSVGCNSVDIHVSSFWLCFNIVLVLSDSNSNSTMYFSRFLSMLFILFLVFEKLSSLQ